VVFALVVVGFGLWLVPNDRTFDMSVDGTMVQVSAPCRLPIADVFSSTEGVQMFGYSASDGRIEDSMPCRSSAWWRSSAGAMCFVVAVSLWLRARSRIRAAAPAPI
jgi:hypothetical protein